MSSNPLMMVRKVETYTSWLALSVAGCWVPRSAVFAGCAVTEYGPAAQFQ